MRTYHTADGSIIEARTVGDHMDLHVKTCDGQTLATVVLPRAEALVLLRGTECR